MTHPLVAQLRFTRKEFLRSVKGVSEADAQKRILPMNCLSWNVGHLAWQEQRYFLIFAQRQMPFPEINKLFAYGAPASEPSLKEVLTAWKAITAAADPWLDTLTPTALQQEAASKGKPTGRLYGNLLQRTIYHYWYHAGENMAIRQLLGHERLPQFVGAIDSQAPYRPETAVSTAPEGYNAVSPYLIVNGASDVIAFLIKALDGEEIRRFANEDGSLMHAEVRIQDSVIMLGDGGDNWPAVPAHIHVYVPDVDAYYQRALAAGAESVQEPMQQEGDEDKRGGVKDSSGVTWWLATKVAATKLAASKVS